MIRAGRVLAKLLALAVIVLYFPAVAQAEDSQDVLRQVDDLTDGLNIEQMEDIKRLVDEKLKALSNDTGLEKIQESHLIEEQESVKESRLILKLKQRFFFYNLENTNFDIRRTRTFFGDILEAKLSYQLGRQVSISGGVVAIVPFSEFELRWGDYYRDFRNGDHSNKRVDLLQPYIQLRYDYHNFSFFFGDIETPHDFHKLMVYDVYEYLRPTEKGMQILYDGSLITQDLFINWREKNTPDNLERFNIGSLSKLKWKNGSLALQMLYIHRGGEEFSYNPDTFENFSTAFVLDHSFPVKWSFIDGIGIELVPMYTNDLPPDSGDRKRIDGFGALSSFYLTSGDWLFKSGYWIGSDDVLAEEGIPFSREKRYVYVELALNKKLKYDIGLHFLITGGLFGSDLDSGFWDQKLVISWRHDFGL